MAYFNEKSIKGNYTSSMITSSGTPQIGSLAADSYNVMLEFCRHLLVAHAYPPATAEWRIYDTIKDSPLDPKARKAVKSFLYSLWSTSSDEMRIDGKFDESLHHSQENDIFPQSLFSYTKMIEFSLRFESAGRLP